MIEDNKKAEGPINVYDFSFEYTEKVTGKMVAVSEEAALEGLQRDYDKLGELREITLNEVETFPTLEDFITTEKKRRIETIANELGLEIDEVEAEINRQEEKINEEKRILN